MKIARYTVSGIASTSPAIVNNCCQMLSDDTTITCGKFKIYCNDKRKNKIIQIPSRHDNQVSIGVDKTKINTVLLLRPAYCDAQATVSKL